ncbi:hypothetical protein QQ045_005447 [Rhodiola kirilowii]
MSIEARGWARFRASLVLHRRRKAEIKQRDSTPTSLELGTSEKAIEVLIAMAVLASALKEVWNISSEIPVEKCFHVGTGSVKD